MPNDRTGWFADPGDPEDEGYLPNFPWQAVLQCDGHTATLGMWFASKADCERFIRDDVIGKEMLPDD